MSKHALCVGINDYPGTGSDLQGCVNDARDWHGVLQSRGYRAKLLLDQEATKSRLVAELRALVDGAVPGDSVVFTYSGHGSWVPELSSGDEGDGRDEVLCPHDIANNRPLSDDELNKLLARAAPGVHVAVIADSCHSGTVTRAPKPPANETGARPRFLALDRFLPHRDVKLAEQRSAPARNRGPARRLPGVLLAGCQDHEYSYDASFGGRANGAFTHFALEALRQLPEEATYDDWHRRIATHLPTEAYLQSPNLLASTEQKRWRIFQGGANGTPPPEAGKRRIEATDLDRLVQGATAGQVLDLGAFDVDDLRTLGRAWRGGALPRPRSDGQFELGAHTSASVEWWGIRIEFDHEAVAAQTEAFTVPNLMLVGVPPPACFIVAGAIGMIAANDRGNGVIAFVTWAGVHWYLPR